MIVFVRRPCYLTQITSVGVDEFFGVTLVMVIILNSKCYKLWCMLYITVVQFFLLCSCICYIPEQYVWFCRGVPTKIYLHSPQWTGETLYQLCFCYSQRLSPGKCWYICCRCPNLLSGFGREPL